MAVPNGLLGDHPLPEDAERSFWCHLRRLAEFSETEKAAGASSPAAETSWPAYSQPVGWHPSYIAFFCAMLHHRA